MPRRAKSSLPTAMVRALMPTPAATKRAAKQATKAARRTVTRSVRAAPKAPKPANTARAGTTAKTGTSAKTRTTAKAGKAGRAGHGAAARRPPPGAAGVRPRGPVRPGHRSPRCPDCGSHPAPGGLEVLSGDIARLRVRHRRPGGFRPRPFGRPAGPGGRLGERAVVITGSRPDRHRALIEALPMAFAVVPAGGEPTVEHGAGRGGSGPGARRGCGDRDRRRQRAGPGQDRGDAARQRRRPVGLPGGDRRGRPITAPSVPFTAIPTTAGTGAEVTENAVLASPEHGRKASLRSPLMIPRLALVDPLLTLDCPPAVTAASGLDALTQCLEPLVSPQATPLTDALAREGLRTRPPDCEPPTWMAPTSPPAPTWRSAACSGESPWPTRNSVRSMGSPG